MSEAHPFEDVLAAFALGALDAAEVPAVTAHLAKCPECQAELKQLRATVAALAVSAPTVNAPQGMRERVLRRATKSDGKTIGRTKPVLTSRAPWMLAAAGFALAAVLGWSFARERAERNALLASLERAETDLAARDSMLAVSNEMLERVLGPEVQTTTLAATGAAPSMRIFWDHGRSVMIVSARRLPPAAAGRTYQLWGIGADGKPVGIGTFNTLQDGAAVVTLAVAPGSRFTVSAVTDEPAGGSPQPTTTPFLVGNWPTT